MSGQLCWACRGRARRFGHPAPRAEASAAAAERPTPRRPLFFSPSHPVRHLPTLARARLARAQGSHCCAHIPRRRVAAAPGSRCPRPGISAGQGQGCAATLSTQGRGLCPELGDLQFARVPLPRALNGIPAAGRGCPGRIPPLLTACPLPAPRPRLLPRSSLPLRTAGTPRAPSRPGSATARAKKSYGNTRGR